MIIMWEKSEKVFFTQNTFLDISPEQFEIESSYLDTMVNAGLRNFRYIRRHFRLGQKVNF